MVILAIIVYDRVHNIELWARTKPTLPVYVIHTGPERDSCKKICSDAGFIYIPRENRGLDIGSVQDVFRERLEGFPNDWTRLIWCTDDVIPVTPQWLTPFIESTADLAAFQISLTPVRHVRTTAYCITKELSRKIQFPADPVVSKEQGYQYEYKGGHLTLTSQAEELGATIEQVTPTGLWDQGYGKRPELLPEYIFNFGLPVPLVDVLIERPWKIRLNKEVAYNVTTGYDKKRVKQWLCEQGVIFNIVNP